MSYESQTSLLSDVEDVRTVQETEQGTLSIVPRCPPGLFSRLELDNGLGNFAHYSSIIQKLDVFAKVASQRDGRVTLAIIGDKVIVGYAACWYPGPDERWSKLGDLLYEMGALEVSRNFRRLNLGSKIIGIIMEDDMFNDKIAYMNGFSWHWDLDGTGLTMAEYRQVMMRLLKPHGFQECYTNEPNIALREENLFMVRIGSRVSEEDRAQFRDLRFGIVRKKQAV
ncbi:MAG: N-acetyltransferase [Deltaproteobacteria bacterium]